MDLPRLQLAGGIGGDVVGEAQRFGAGDIDLAHVAYIEDADALAHGEVLFDQRRVLDGHVPSAEIHHFGARRAMDRVEGGGLQGGGGEHQTGSVATGWWGVKPACPASPNYCGLVQRNTDCSRKSTAELFPVVTLSGQHLRNIEP